jgi:hypothetical protein
MRSLTLIIPDLQSTLIQADEAGQALPLLRQLTQSSCQPCEPYEDEPTAFYRFLGEAGPLPSAELWAHHYKLPPAEAWLMAEPIECQADKASIYCLGTAHLGIIQAEANQFVESLNQHLIPAGMRLYAPEPARWLIALSKPLTVHTQSLNTIVNRALSQTPSLFTELQMLLHHHPLNRERAAAGKPQVHACWLSGEGKLPVLSQHPSLGVIADHPQTRVLAEWIGATLCQSLNNLEATILHYEKSVTEMVVCLSAQQHAIVLEQNDMKSLLTSGLRKRFQKIRVYGGDNLCYDAPRKWTVE